MTPRQPCFLFENFHRTRAGYDCTPVVIAADASAGRCAALSGVVVTAGPVVDGVSFFHDGCDRAAEQPMAISWGSAPSA